MAFAVHTAAPAHKILKGCLHSPLRRLNNYSLHALFCSHSSYCSHSTLIYSHSTLVSPQHITFTPPTEVPTWGFHPLAQHLHEVVIDLVATLETLQTRRELQLGLLDHWGRG